MSDGDLVDRLLDDAISHHVISSDVDDVNLYGSKHRRRVAGPTADRLTQSGLEPEIYQAVSWWCLVFIPLVPLGTYAVADFRELLPDGDDHSRCFRVQMDWSQATLHAMIGMAVVVTVGLATWFAVVHANT
ncbi:hypothetical protein UC8_21990 [Roseimaritima ulvae]|uniref:Uncharacterized protein n=2 Tax=Roseimaritima ulvae TaxID=980254 RepID=A0A5B9R1J3_9BACT|nr:hypothetical protein UC8_21990 [Roseimaritima ulvae]